MELGATVCVPNAEPRCGDCPISAACAARQAVLRYEREGGDPAAAVAPRVTEYPTKVNAGDPSALGSYQFRLLGHPVSLSKLGCIVRAALFRTGSKGPEAGGAAGWCCGQRSLRV